MNIKRYRVTGRLRLGPGDIILLDDEEKIAELQRIGVIEAEPIETLTIAPRIKTPEAKKQED